MCKEKDGILIIKQLWKENKNVKVPYLTFFETLTELLNPPMNQNKIKKKYSQYLQAMLSNSYDDSVDFVRFCDVISFFGPLNPLLDFLERIKFLVSQPFFHGFINSSKATNLVNSYDNLKSTVFLYRFDDNELEGLVLTFANNTGLYNINIKRDEKGFFKEKDSDVEYSSFSVMHDSLKKIYGLKKHVPSSLYHQLKN